jgi:alkaline phosphatase D
VTNNFNSETELLPTGRQAFFEYWPIDTHESVTGSDPHRIYRSFRWGKHLEVFLLDTRQYRSPNSMPESKDKTMLGQKQLSWLKDFLAASE